MTAGFLEEAARRINAHAADADVASRALDACVKLCKSRPAGRRRLVSSGMVAAALLALNAHTGALAVQQEGSHVLFLASREPSGALASLGVPAAAVAALVAHPDDVSVIRCCAQALMCCCKADESLCEAAVAAGALPALVAVLRLVPPSLELQTPAVFALAAILERKTTAFVAPAVAAGVVEVAVAAATRYPADPQLAFCCLVILIATCNAPEARHLAAAAGGFAAAVGALRANPEDADMQALRPLPHVPR